MLLIATEPGRPRACEVGAMDPSDQTAGNDSVAGNEQTCRPASAIDVGQKTRLATRREVVPNIFFGSFTIVGALTCPVVGPAVVDSPMSGKDSVLE